MDKTPVITVIVTTYERKDLLTKTIKSILNQTYTDFELIVVDNYSKYDFFGLIGSFGDNRIIAFQNQNDGIIAVNRNYALEKARGEFIAFCDDDDYWEPGKLMCQYNKAKKSGFEKVAVYTNANCFGEDIKNYTSEKKQINTVLDVLVSSNIFFSSLFISHPGAVRFGESREIVGSEDFKFICDLYFSGYKFLLESLALINYYISFNSISNTNTGYSYLRKNYIINYCILKYKGKKNFQIMLHQYTNLIKYILN